MRLAVLHFPDDYPSWVGRFLPKSLFGRLCRASHYKRNPRDETYMRARLREAFGERCEIAAAVDVRQDVVRGAGEIVLLWPDGNGYGWLTIERRLLAWKSPASRLIVLNGRRREFELRPLLLSAYIARRVLERFWLGEILFSLVFAFVSPLLVTVDLLRFRR